MRGGFALALAPALFAGAVALTPLTASAMPLGVGAASGLEATNPMIEQVQVRRFGGGGGARVGVVRGPRVGAVRGVPVRGGYRGGYRGNGAAVGAAIGLGILGAAAAAAAANAQPVYEPAQECYWDRQDVYDRWGNYRGQRRVRVCQ